MYNRGMASETTPGAPIPPTSPRMPSPWLTPTIASLAFLFTCILWPYIQMRHSSDSRVDEMQLATNIVLSLIAWGLLGLAVFVNLRDARRAARLRVTIQTLNDEHKTQLQYACNEKIRQLSERIKATSDSMSKRMQESEYPLMMAGQLNLLAEEALWLSGTLKAILDRNTTDRTIDLSYPLTRGLIFLDPSDDGVPLPWQRIQLMAFSSRYTFHIKHLVDGALSAIGSSPDVITQIPPSHLEADSLLMGLTKHRTALVNKAAELAAPYLEARKAVAIQAAKLLAETDASPTIS
jgi:hypothetical protein